MKVKKSWIAVLTIIVFCVLQFTSAPAIKVSACTTEEPEPTVTVTPEPTTTVTPEPTVTVTPEPTATVTPEPTATVTPEPTATTAPEPTPDVTTYTVAEPSPAPVNVINNTQPTPDVETPTLTVEETVEEEPTPVVQETVDQEEEEEEEETPIEETEEVPEEEIPEGTSAEELPKTGTADPFVFYLGGSALIILGYYIIKKKNKLV